MMKEVEKIDKCENELDDCNSINSDKIKFNLSEFSRAYIWGKPWRWSEITQKIYEKEPKVYQIIL